MKKLFTLAAAIAFTAITLNLSWVQAQSGDVELEFKPSTLSANVGDEVTVDIMLKNPSQQNVISVRTWLEFNPNHLEGVSVNTSGTEFTLSAPGEDEASNEEGRIKIGRSNISGGVSDSEVKIATVTFKVKTSSGVTTVIKANDYQVTELGHTSVNIIEQGFPVNVLSGAPDDITLTLNGGPGAAPSTGITLPEVPIGGPTAPVNLLRPTGLKVNTGSGYADLQWDQALDPNRVGYNVYYGKISGQYTRRRTIENLNFARIDNLTNGEAYFFAITAYDQFNRESDYSDEVGIIINQPLSSTSPFAGVLQGILGQLPAQPQNGPLAWWLVLSAIGLSGTLLFRSKKTKVESINPYFN